MFLLRGLWILTNLVIERAGMENQERTDGYCGVNFTATFGSRALILACVPGE